jgi:hypothetical protein
MEKLQLLYEQMIEDDDLMKELEDIIQYASEKMKSAISSGTEIYEFVEDKLTVFPVGILPIKIHEGYFFLSDGAARQTRVYKYRLSIFEKHDEKYRAIKTEFVNEWQRSIVNTYENIKAELLKRDRELAHPAVYSIETSLTFPIDETLLPIAKRTLVRYISSNAA